MTGHQLVAAIGGSAGLAVVALAVLNQIIFPWIHKRLDARRERLNPNNTQPGPSAAVEWGLYTKSTMDAMAETLSEVRLQLTDTVRQLREAGVTVEVAEAKIRRTMRAADAMAAEDISPAGRRTILIALGRDDDAHNTTTPLPGA